MRAMYEQIRALAVMAHPDDIDFNAAGTIAKWVHEGVAVTYLLVTSGEAGGHRSVSREEIATTRRREQCEAARVVKVDDVRFLEGYRDGHVEVTADLVRDIVRVIRQVRPHRVMAMSPERDWFRIHQGHPDHLAVGEATARAVYPAARNPFAFPELTEREALEEWTVDEYWIQAHPRPNHAEDITDEFHLKLRALHAHESQLPDPDALEGHIRALLESNAAGMGLPEGRLAETFLKVAVS
jgi:LmbE family N-acetylglucosaminyl deacetylase